MVNYHIRYFGDYVLLGELGRGAVGIVYHARQVRLNRPVALKLLCPGTAVAETVYRRFLREIEASASLDHPHIVPVYEAGETDGTLFLSMKLLAGGTLAERLKHETLPPTTAAALLLPIAGAVHYAHEHAVLHRDLKPSNILLDEEGLPHLADFGIAKLAHDSVDATATMAVLGTPAYMAPEVALAGAKAATMAADIYGLGALLYEMVTGRAPYTGSSPLEILARLQSETPTPPTTLRSNLPRDLEMICLKCMDREPGRRYASAAELVSDLERYLRGEPVSVRPLQPVERFWRWCRQHKGRAAWLAATSIMLVLGVTGVTWQWRRAESFLSQSQATAARLADDLARSNQQDAEDLLRTEAPQDGLKMLARLVHDNPANSAASARLFSALSQRSCLWPAIPPLNHTAPVRQGECSADGKWIATAADDGLLHLWERSSGKHRLALPHETAAGRFVLSPNSAAVATLTRVGTVQLWQLPSATAAFSPFELGEKATALAFSADSALLGVAGTNGQVRVWRSSDGTTQGSFEHGESVRAIHFRPGRTELLTVGQTHCSLWRLEPVLTRIATCRPSGSPTLACFARAGDKYLTVSGEVVEVWRAEDGVLLRRVTCQAAVRHADFSPDGVWLAVANEAERAQIYNVASGERRTASLIHGHSVVNSARFDPLGHFLVTATRDGLVRVWAASATRLAADPIQHRGEVLDASFSPDGNNILTVSADRTARLWTAPRPLAAAFDLAGSASRCAVSPDGNLIATMDESPGLFLTSTADNQSRRLLPPHERAPTLAEISEDNLHLASADPDGVVCVTDLRSNESRVLGQRLEAPVHHLRWSPDSKQLAIGTTNAVWLFNVEKPIGDAPTPGETLPARRIPVSGMASVLFSPNRRHVVIADEAAIRVLDPQGSVEVARGPRPASRATTLSLSPNGEWIASGSTGNVVHVWSARDGGVIGPVLQPGFDVTVLCFAPDGRSLLTGGGNGSLRLWSLPDGVVIQEYPPHRRAILSAQFSPDGQWFVTSAEDHFVVLWQTASGLRATDAIEARFRPNARFSRDGSRVIVTTEGGAVRFVQSPGAGLPTQATLQASVELLLGQRLGPRGGWVDLSVEEHAARMATSAQAWRRIGPPPQLRDFRPSRERP